MTSRRSSTVKVTESHLFIFTLMFAVVFRSFPQQVPIGWLYCSHKMTAVRVAPDHVGGHSDKSLTHFLSSFIISISTPEIF
ncbi:Uncharacterised protein [Vibrio cholerae]|nr:Uncharacterised protein [Vibrio cholerae]